MNHYIESIKCALWTKIWGGSSCHLEKITKIKEELLVVCLCTHWWRNCTWNMWIIELQLSVKRSSIPAHRTGHRVLSWKVDFQCFVAVEKIANCYVVGVVQKVEMACNWIRSITVIPFNFTKIFAKAFCNFSFSYPSKSFIQKDGHNC